MPHFSRVVSARSEDFAKTGCTILRDFRRMGTTTLSFLGFCAPNKNAARKGRAYFYHHFHNATPSPANANKFVEFSDPNSHFGNAPQRHRKLIGLVIPNGRSSARRNLLFLLPGTTHTQEPSRRAADSSFVHASK
jgi:hypothetical protein